MQIQLAGYFQSPTGLRRILRTCQLVGLFISLLRRAKVVFFAGSENPSIFERQAFGNIHRKRLGYTCKLAHISIATARL